MVINKKVIE